MKCVGNISTTIEEPSRLDGVNAFSKPLQSPICSFSGKSAEFYIGLAGSNLGDGVRVIGAISTEYVETAIVNVMGQGVDEIQWPVILDLNKNILYHSYEAHLQDSSAIMGWKKLIKFETKDESF
ncbi:hypothetical protein [Arenibacter sp. S6351L]|uniref:hypothetical protein n=1 Tax=Arenibacter sp. S6351L TaxID=2926407 RepID=UPI001FF366E9|nr:hypothetical protein [Arenibacter sp. S6351L]MCK0136083.1 hypothetical protein [Arenibacter sp. S6351L]